MSYKTIVVHADLSRHAPARIRLAARIALAADAHLVGAAMTGISRFIYKDNALALTGPLVAAQLDLLVQRAHAGLARFEAIAAEMGLRSFEKRLIEDEPEGGLALQARYCDLLVLGQTDPAEPTPSVIADLPEYVMLHSARPVLMVPYAGSFEDLAGTALVAWDGSMEATRAITAAVPLLQRAASVCLALFNPDQRPEAHGAQPGADIALYLARHGVKVEVRTVRTDIEVGHALLSLAADLDATLLVMGGYGHARLREILLGGVTSTILKTMTLPVLMAH